MKYSQHNPEPLVLKEGYFIDKYYNNYEDMEDSAKNWKYNCLFQLKPNALLGHNRILQLSFMQIGYVSRSGGLMHDTYSAIDCISVAIIENCEGKACFHRTKLESGDIIFFDNLHPYNFVINSHIDLIVINIKISHLGLLNEKISKIFNHTIKDIDGAFSKFLNNTWKQFTNNSENKHIKDRVQEVEKKIMSIIKALVDSKEYKVPKLNKGEEVALKIRDQIYTHMDGKVDIYSLAKQYKVSEGTLQNSFKSLFGFTPKYFLRQMKLNLVYRDLKQANYKEETVLNIARRWGFMHMGHFSNYYTKLFNENPSQTLKKSYLDENIISNECVERKEEI